MNANNFESPERKLVMWYKCKEKCKRLQDVVAA